VGIFALRSQSLQRLPFRELCAAGLRIGATPVSVSWPLARVIASEHGIAVQVRSRIALKVLTHSSPVTVESASPGQLGAHWFLEWTEIKSVQFARRGLVVQGMTGKSGARIVFLSRRKMRALVRIVEDHGIVADHVRFIFSRKF
jgi:hypothetical protein